MTLLRDITDLIDDHEELVKTSSHEECITDSKYEVRKFSGFHFYDDDGTLHLGTVQDAIDHAPRLGLRVVSGSLSILLPDELDEDGTVIYRRVIIPQPVCCECY